jgi:hypothetical protein
LLPLFQCLSLFLCLFLLFSPSLFLSLSLTRHLSLFLSHFTHFVHSSVSLFLSLSLSLIFGQFRILQMSALSLYSLNADLFSCCNTNYFFSLFLPTGLISVGFYFQ